MARLAVSALKGRKRRGLISRSTRLIASATTLISLRGEPILRPLPPARQSAVRRLRTNAPNAADRYSSGSEIGFSMRWRPDGSRIAEVQHARNLQQSCKGPDEPLISPLRLSLITFGMPSAECAFGVPIASSRTARRPLMTWSQRRMTRGIAGPHVPSPQPGADEDELYVVNGVTWRVRPVVSVIEVPPKFPQLRFVAVNPHGGTISFSVPWPPRLRPFSRRAIEQGLAAAVEKGAPQQRRGDDRC